MVKVREDLTGWKMWEHGFENSKIIVVEQAEDYISPQGEHKAQWKCKCNCGNPDVFTVKATHLKKGDTQSCGCLKKEKSRERLKKYNIYKLNLKDQYGIYGIGYCRNTKREFYFDMDDYPKIKDYCWYEDFHKVDNYASLQAWETNKKIHIPMHHLITEKFYDHIDRNPFNNRKHNLRKASFLQNSRNKSLAINNTSGVTGVGLDKSTNKWRAYIGINYKIERLGYFTNKEDAIRARLQAEKEYFGEFAPQRHLFKEYGIEDDFSKEK